jgi:hypothetical protein
MALIIRTSEYISSYGLVKVGFAETRQNVSMEINESRFISNYGAKPNVLAAMWLDFQTTTVANARIDAKHLCLNYFLMTLNFLKCYQKEAQLSGLFGVSEKTARKWVKFYIMKIAALKAAKVSESKPIFM